MPHKRKHVDDDGSDNVDKIFTPASQIEIPSEDEDEENPDDDEVEDFPELDLHSDSESDSDELLDDEEEEEGTESEDDSSEDLHIFPKAKKIISDIIGQPKRVYPEIEPDYDSDSSTEDVCVSFGLFLKQANRIRDPKSRRKNTYALV